MLAQNALNHGCKVIWQQGCSESMRPHPLGRQTPVGGPQIKLDKLSLDQSGDFTDSLAVFAAPKRIGLKSHIQLSGVLVKSSLITLSDVSTHLRPG
jgi:hypothetical protein